MLRFKTSSLFILLALCILSSRAQGSSFSLTDEASTMRVSPPQYLIDVGGKLGIDDIRSSSQTFELDTEESISVSPDSDIYWIKFSLSNARDQGGEWVLNFSKWVGVDAWIVNQNGRVEHRKTGHLVPVNQRDYSRANEATILVSLEKGETKDFFVRLETHNNYLVRPNTLNFKVSQRSYFDQQEGARSTRIAFFVGIFMVMFFYNLFLFLSTKDQNYVYYLVILLCVIFLTLHNFGYTVALLDFIPGYVNWHSKMHFIVPGIMSVNIFLFIRGMLDVKKRYPLLNKWVTVIIVISISLPIPSLLGYALFNDGYSNLAGMLALTTVLTIAIRSVIDKYPSAIYFLIGYGCFAIGIMLQILSFEHVLPENTINYNPLQIGSAIEVIMFSFALANRINILKKDNEEKQEKIILQLRDNEQLQTKVNRELEQKVAERTAKIEAQKDTIQKEMEKSDELLLNILPKATADELKLHGKAKPRYYDMVSVLFSDFKGFTQIAEKLAPEDLVKELDYCFRKFDEIVERNGLEKIKTIGDAYMCAGGIPMADEDNPARIVNAALEMQEFMKQWQEEKASRNDEAWELRLGIHTGPVTSGVVGKNKFAYDIWGDTVNLASRMESSGEVGKVNISEDTHKFVQNQFRCVHRGKIQAKNKGEVDMYFVEGSLFQQ